MASKQGLYKDSEVTVLTNLYERGLRSKTKHKSLLDEAIQKTGLESERIMVNNYLSLSLIRVSIDKHLKYIYNLTGH